MELSKRSLDVIVIAGDSSVISDSLYVHILQLVCEVAEGFPIENVNDQELRNGSSKAAFSGLLTLLLEAAKNDTDSASLTSVLEECKLSTKRISQFITKFQESKRRIQAALSRIGRSFPHVTDVDWRQDYLIKTNSSEKICEPTYIVSLKTLNSQFGSQDDVTFACSVEQLQDLVGKLKDAAKCIERNAHP